MRLLDQSAKDFTGCAVFTVGQLEVSVSNVFGATSTTCVFERATKTLLREWPGNSAATVAKALRFALRRN